MADSETSVPTTVQDQPVRREPVCLGQLEGPTSEIPVRTVNGVHNDISSRLLKKSHWNSFSL
jgi:hypothetical protein